jgi:SAM-dependent methyltransferase
MASSPTPQESADRARAEISPLIDLQMSPLGIAAMDALAPAEGQTVLDVGCGAGETLLQLAQRLGPTGRVIGVDIAPQVLAVARARTALFAQVTVMQADAGSLTLPDDSLDGVYSRFGTMFFPDPVAAFSNLRRMLRRGGRIGFICWRSMRENEVDVFPLAAARLPADPDNAPFSFEDDAVIERTLQAAGFADIRIEPHDDEICCGDTEATLRVVTRVGALGMVLRRTPALVPEVLEAVRAVLLARERDGEVKLGAATWIVTAVAS